MEVYTEQLRRRMVEKMTAPGGPSAGALSREVGISQPTLSRWIRERGEGVCMDRSKQRRPQDWTGEEKLRAMVEVSGMSEEEVGNYLREKGLHTANLKEWRNEMVSAVGSKKKRKGKDPRDLRIKELERELKRKDKALAEMSTLIILKKKAQAIWGDGDEE